MEKCLQTIAALICGILSYMYGEFDGMMKILIFCIVCDYITGLASAYKNKELSSRTGFIGILKKVTILLIVALCHIMDMELFRESAFMKSAVCGFYIAFVHTAMARTNVLNRTTTMQNPQVLQSAHIATYTENQLKQLKEKLKISLMQLSAKHLNILCISILKINPLKNSEKNCLLICV